MFTIASLMDFVETLFASTIFTPFLKSFSSPLGIPEFFRLPFKISRKNNFTSSCFRFCKDCILPSLLIHISWLFFRFAAMNFSQCSLLDISGPLLTKLLSIFFACNKNINASFDDDSALFTNDEEKVVTIIGSKKNLKITDKEDLNIFKSLKKGKTYSGIGFDIHRLVKGRKLYLGGIKIPFALGLQGHSDADPVLHSIIDSLLGACKLGDIGKLFSNKNKKYKNIRSTILLKKVIELIKFKNFSINNIDINVIVQKPKIKKYSKKMIDTISELCEINPNQINIKGKTTEKLGLIGKGKAIAAEVIASIIKYD